MMKKFLTIVLLAFVSQGIFAQDKLTLGVEVGANMSNFNSERSIIEGDALIAVAGGVSLMYSLSENIYLKTGLNYANKGETFEFSGSLDPFDPVIRPIEDIDTFITTLSVPFYAGYRTNGTTRFFVNGGPFISFVLDSEVFIEKDIDYGLGFGLGLEYDFSDTQGVRLEVRNEFGLANVNGAPLDTATISTNSLGLFLSYQVKL